MKRVKDGRKELEEGGEAGRKEGMETWEREGVENGDVVGQEGAKNKGPHKRRNKLEKLHRHLRNIAQETEKKNRKINNIYSTYRKSKPAAT